MTKTRPPSLRGRYGHNGLCAPRRDPVRGGRYRGTPFTPGPRRALPLSLAPCSSRVFAHRFGCLAGGRGAGFEMTTLWVETPAGYLTEGLQVSEDPASSEDWSRAHLFRERLALREHPLPNGPAPSSWCVCPTLQTSSRA